MELTELSSRSCFCDYFLLIASLLTSLWGPVDCLHQGPLGSRGRGGGPSC